MLRKKNGAWWYSDDCDDEQFWYHTRAVSNNSRGAGCSPQQNRLAQLQSRGTANAPINYLSPVITGDLEGIRFYCLTHDQQSLDCTSSVA